MTVKEQVIVIAIVVIVLFVASGFIGYYFGLTKEHTIFLRNFDGDSVMLSYDNDTFWESIHIPSDNTIEIKVKAFPSYIQFGGK